MVVNIFILVQSNCNGTKDGQVINLSLHKTLEDAEQAGQKSSWGEMQIDNIMGWWHEKKQMFCYIEEKNLELDKN